LKKIQKLHIQIVAVILKVTSYKTMSKKRVKKQDSMGKKNFFLSTLPFSPWVVSATWLYVGKYRKNELNTCFQQKFATGSYGVGIGRAWCSWKACEICRSLVQKKKLKNNKNSSHKLLKLQLTSFWSQGILGVN
jgi:hypothetical protein